MSQHAQGTLYVAPRTAQEVSARLAAIYGEDPARATGVIHPAAVVRARDGLLHVLRIGPHAPKSSQDFFLLQAVRARADVVITSAANLRAEPHLSHDFVGESADALAQYRTDVVLKTQPLVVFILTQSGELPARHPVFDDGAIKHVLAPTAAHSRLRAMLPSEITVHAIEDLHVRAAIALARSFGHVTISIETGPTLSRACYGEASIVDELCLSTYLGAELAPEALGGALPADAELFKGRALHASAYELEGWSFARYL